jgi:hypothetical protein
VGDIIVVLVLLAGVAFPFILAYCTIQNTAWGKKYLANRKREHAKYVTESYEFEQRVSAKYHESVRRVGGWIKPFRPQPFSLVCTYGTLIFIIGVWGQANNIGKDTTAMYSFPAFILALYLAYAAHTHHQTLRNRIDAIEAQLDELKTSPNMKPDKIALGLFPEADPQRDRS